jgi:chromosome segregation and condensation protein ScpB
MDFWELSSSQIKALKQIKEKGKPGLHRSVMYDRTRQFLVRLGLTMISKQHEAYYVLTKKGKDILSKVEDFDES